MKNTIIKTLAAIVLMAGITPTQATDKGVIERVKEKVREVVKEINRPVHEPPRPAIAVAVRG